MIANLFSVKISNSDDNYDYELIDIREVNSKSKQSKVKIQSNNIS